MNPRALYLLSPYRLPAQHSLMLSNEDVAAFLNGYAALWHPAALEGAGGPPSVASPYDHEVPVAGHIYAVPESPPLVLPDDWDQRVREAGAVAFRSSPDRGTTLVNLKEALRTLAASASAGAAAEPTGDSPPPPASPCWQAVLLDLAAEQAAPFFGIGFGFLQVGALFEAMEHENVLAAADLWEDVRQAVEALGGGDAGATHGHLQAAADRLLTAREVLYAVTIHVLDLSFVREDALDAPLPATFDKGLPLNLLAPGALLEKLAEQHPERLAAIRDRVRDEELDIVGGCYLEREDGLLPVESQLWNLLKGLRVSRELTGEDVRVFGRRRTAAHPQLPLFLKSVGIHWALLVSFDESALPSHRTPVVGWPSPDGKQVEAFARTPYQADNPQTGFHVAHYLHQTIMQDQAATLALVHGATPAGDWYGDWLELSRFAPVLGQWTTFTRYFNDVQAGEQASAASADDFHTDYLSERTGGHSAEPVSWFARQVRERRRLDTVWTLMALHRGLAGSDGLADLEPRLAALEDQLEEGHDPAAALDEVETEVAQALAGRLQARAAPDQPGYLVLNPCSFARRVALELEPAAGPLPIAGPVKACQLDADHTRLVVEVPALGFAWVPRSGPPGAAPPPMRMRLADPRHVRNEFLEAEIDPATGGLRGLWDHRTRVSRLGQQLVFNPGSSMRATEVKVTSSGPALGEVVSEGGIFDEGGAVLATFRQRFRAWLGRPLLELRIEIYPEHAPEGYPWHSYYGARFAWRDEHALLLRGLNGTGYVTSHTRPETPEYLEVRSGQQTTALFPGGLPFHQRHGGRMVDVVLVPEGETARVFDVAVGLDREHPTQTAFGLVSPVPVVATGKGPPHVGPSGWLFHLDAPNLLLTSLRPGRAGADAVVARLLECNLYDGQAEFRCIRNPRRAVLLDARGEQFSEASTSGDAVLFEVTQGDLLHLSIEFS
jgi:hypothetical protein